MLKLKLQYFTHLMRRTDSFEKTLMLRKTEGGRRRGWQRMRWLDGHQQLDGFEQAPGVGDGQGRLACCSPWGRKESDTTEWLNWPKSSLNGDWPCSYYLCILLLVVVVLVKISVVEIVVFPWICNSSRNSHIPWIWVLFVGLDICL